MKAVSREPVRARAGSRDTSARIRAEPEPSDLLDWRGQVRGRRGQAPRLRLTHELQLQVQMQVVQEADATIVTVRSSLSSSVSSM